MEGRERQVRRGKRELAPRVYFCQFLAQWEAMCDRLQPGWREGVDVDGLNLAMLDLAGGDQVCTLDPRKLEVIREFLGNLKGHMIGIFQEAAVKNPEFRQAAWFLGWIFAKERGDSIANPLVRGARCEAIARFLTVIADAAEHLFSRLRLAAEERGNRILRRNQELFPDLTKDAKAIAPENAVIGREAAKNVFAQLKDDLDDSAFAVLREYLADPGGYTVREVAARHGVSPTSVSRSLKKLRVVAKPYLDTCDQDAQKVFAETLIDAFRVA